MQRCLFLVPLFFAVASHAGAQDKAYFRCEVADGAGHRDTRCIAQQSDRTVSVPVGNVSLQTRTQPSGNETRAIRPLTARYLYIGMTDTQVLNLPSCGRPARILRSKELQTWREQWTYLDPRSGEERRVLYFENGRLIKQEYTARGDSITARAKIDDEN